MTAIDLCLWAPLGLILWTLAILFALVVLGFVAKAFREARPRKPKA